MTELELAVYVSDTAITVAKSRRLEPSARRGALLECAIQLERAQKELLHMSESVNETKRH